MAKAKEPAIEPLLTPGQIARKFGVSAEFVRQACFREVNPCPHIDISNTPGRHYWRIRASWFERWLLEEAERTGQSA